MPVTPSRSRRDSPPLNWPTLVLRIGEEDHDGGDFLLIRR